MHPSLLSQFDLSGKTALVTGASRGLGISFARGLAKANCNLVIAARDLDRLTAVASDLQQYGVRAVPVKADVSQIKDAEAMVQRNCIVPMQLCHHFAPAMVERGSGGIVLFGSGAGLAGGPNMVAYGASKAFDMVFAEALWAELHDKGIDVLGLILGKTNTPALRALEYSRGQIGSPDEVPADAAAVEDVIAEAFENLGNGPTLMVGDTMRAAAQFLASLSRNQAVEIFTQAAAAAMGPDD